MPPLAPAQQPARPPGHLLRQPLRPTQGPREHTAPRPIAAHLPLRRPERAQLLLRKAQVACFSATLSFFSHQVTPLPPSSPGDNSLAAAAAGAAVAGAVAALAAVVAHDSPLLLRPAAQPAPPATPPSAAATLLHRPPCAQRPSREAQAAFLCTFLTHLLTNRQPCTLRQLQVCTPGYTAGDAYTAPFAVHILGCLLCWSDMSANACCRCHICTSEVQLCTANIPRPRHGVRQRSLYPAQWPHYRLPGECLHQCSLLCVLCIQMNPQ